MSSPLPPASRVPPCPACGAQRVGMPCGADMGIARHKGGVQIISPLKALVCLTCGHTTFVPTNLAAVREEAVKNPQKCLFCVQMSRPIPLSRKRANARKRQNFGRSMRNEQELKASLRKPCARVRCGEHTILAAKRSGFRHFSRRQPSICCGHVPG